MKKILIVAIGLFVLASCQEKQRYTQQSSEIDIVKKVINGYNSQEYDLSVFADTSKTFFNTKTNPIELKDIVAYHQANDVNYSERRFLEKDQEFEMVVTDKGHVWVNAWLDWRCTLKENGKVIDMPVHLTYRFVDGKIVRTVGYWDPTEIVLELQANEAEKAMPEIQ
jgi:ketosteroid isomerase-like protein